MNRVWIILLNTTLVDDLVLHLDVCAGNVREVTHDKACVPEHFEKSLLIKICAIEMPEIRTTFCAIKRIKHFPGIDYSMRTSLHEIIGHFATFLREVDHMPNFVVPWSNQDAFVQLTPCHDEVSAILFCQLLKLFALLSMSEEFVAAPVYYYGARDVVGTAVRSDKLT